jgi:hypothetical protein
MESSNGLQVTNKPEIPEILHSSPTESSFSITSFEHVQRVAKMLSSSSLIPKEYQGNIQNTMIALEMANRIGASPLMVMQNLYIVHGKPSWSSTFIIAALNASRRFSPVRFEMAGQGDEYGCQAWAYDVATKDKLEGPKVTMKMAKTEGWVTKAGSKWQTMPELMLRYRAAAFFGRLYAPDIMMGMQTAEEVADVQPVVFAPQKDNKVNKEEERVHMMIDDCTTIQDLENLQMQLSTDELQEHWNLKHVTLANPKQ